MNDNIDIQQLLYTDKKGKPAGHTDMQELDEIDIPWERVPIFIQYINDPKNLETNFYTTFNVGTLLCHWGIDEGFEFCRKLIDLELDKEGVLFPHRLRNYEQLYEFLLTAILSYSLWDNATCNIEECVKKIILKSTHNPFEISRLLPLPLEIMQEEAIIDKETAERLSSYTKEKMENLATYDKELKIYLEAILNNPEKHHWKPMDGVKFFEEYDNEFLEKTLQKIGKTKEFFYDKSNLFL